MKTNGKIHPSIVNRKCETLRTESEELLYKPYWFYLHLTHSSQLKANNFRSVIQERVFKDQVDNGIMKIVVASG